MFDQATRALLEQFPQDSIFVEIGPHSALAGPLRQIFHASVPLKLPAYIPSLVRDANVSRSILGAVGQMHVQGASI